MKKQIFQMYKEISYRLKILTGLTEFTKEGWIFDPQKGEQIQGKFIFGERDSINEDELKFSLGEDDIKNEEIQSDDSIIVVVIIAIVTYQLYFILLSTGSFFELKQKKEFLQIQSVFNNVIE